MTREHKSQVFKYTHKSLVLRSGCVPENVGVNEKVKKISKSKIIFPYELTEKLGVNLTQSSQENGLKLKIKGHKLSSGVYWQRALKHNGVT